MGRRVSVCLDEAPRAESPNLRSHSTHYSIIAMRPDLESAAVLSLQEAPQKPQIRPSIETGYGLAAVGTGCVLHGAVVDWLVGVCAWARPRVLESTAQRG